MSDISEREATLLMVEMRLQLLEIGLKSLNKIIDECAESVDQMEKAVKEIYGSRD